METLKEKRKRLRISCQGYSVNDILDLVEQQDKEFIKLLKEEFVSLEDADIGEQVVWERKDIIPKINRLAGDKLK